MSTVTISKFDFVSEFNEILERMERYSPEIIKSDAEVARVLGVNRTTPSTWRAREKLPLEAIVDYAKKKEINIHWLLTGEGEPSVSQLSTHNKAQHFDNAKAMYANDVNADGRVQKRAAPTIDSINKAMEYIKENLELSGRHDSYQLVETMLVKLSTQTNCEKSELDSFIEYLNSKDSDNEGEITEDIMKDAMMLISAEIARAQAPFNDKVVGMLIKIYLKFKNGEAGNIKKIIRTVAETQAE